MKDMRLLKCVIFGDLVGGAGCVGGQGKVWMRCPLDDFRAYGIIADRGRLQFGTRGNGAGRRNQGRKCFMAKLIAAEKARVGVRHAVVCPNVTGKTKERTTQSKQVRAG